MCLLCISRVQGGLQGEQQEQGCVTKGLLPCWPLPSRRGPDC